MKRTIFGALFALALLLSLACEPTAWPGLSRYKLDNGIELFVYRDEAVPLARVEVCFRAGAMAQTPDTAGLFHLYEHLLFGGDVSTGGSTAVKAALAAIGAAEWNGGTSAERLDYWLSLPSDKVEGGIRFWAERLRPPKFDSADLASAKATVLPELKALQSDPDRVYEAAMEKRLFAKYPWRRDPAGTEAVVRAADGDAMTKIRDTWIVPNNMALVVAGDVDPETVRGFAAAAFGSWKPADDPWKKPNPPHPRPGVPRPTWMVYPDSTMPEGIASVELRYRAPDLGTDPQASYAADLFTALVSDPAGRFKKSVAKNVPLLYGADPVSSYYLSQREGSTLSISSYFSIDAESSAVDRARAFKERVRGIEIMTMRSDPSYFGAKDYEAARARLEASRALAHETADGVADALSYWWATASADYFIGYSSALAKTGSEELAAFVDTYVMHNLEVIALRMNPADYEKEKKLFANSGFDLVGPANAFWWEK